LTALSGGLATTFSLPATGGAAASISAIAFDTDGHNPDDGNNTASHDGTLTVTATDGSSTTTTVDADGSVLITNVDCNTTTAYAVAYAVANDDSSTAMLLAGGSAVGKSVECNTMKMLALGDTAAAKLTNNDGSITMTVTLRNSSTETVPDAGTGGGGGGGAEVELELTAAAHNGSVATTAADGSTYTIESKHNDDSLMHVLYMADDEGESLHFDLAIPDPSLASVQVWFY
jgi:hypothetical protein